MKLGPYELGYNDTNQGIYTGDARLLCEEIPDESIDLIFTDPVYQNIEDYRWLAEMASKKLKPNSALLTFCGIGYLDETLKALTTSLTYRWTSSLMVFGGYRHAPGNLSNKWTCCLWMDVNGTSKSSKRGLWDVRFYKAGYSRLLEQHNHKWAKHIDFVAEWTNAFCPPSGITLDPFTGGGTVPAACKMLSRPYLAFEIDPQTATIAQQRLVATPTPLPGITPTQPNLL